MYETGQGVPRDYEQAFNWYLKAAKQGDPMAEYVIGTMYNYGRGVVQDKSQAALWFNKVCDDSTKMGCNQ